MTSIRVVAIVSKQYYRPARPQRPVSGQSIGMYGRAQATAAMSILLQARPAGPLCLYFDFFSMPAGRPGRVTSVSRPKAERARAAPAAAGLTVLAGCERLVRSC